MKKRPTLRPAPARADLAALDWTLSGWRAHLPRSVWRAVIAQAKTLPPALVGDFLDKYQRVGRDWGFMPYSELSARVMAAVFRCLEKGRLHLRGKEHVARALAALRAGEIRHLCLVCNHTSYTDAPLIRTAFEPLLKRFGFERDFTVVVGPKTFSHPCRKFAALHFNTVQVAQSRLRATPEAALSLSEIAKAARKAIRDLAQHTTIVLVFPEGGRSRSGRLMPFLPGAWRLLNAGKQCGLLPLSIQGSEKVLPVGESCLKGRRVVVRAGPMRPLHEFGAGRAAMEEITRAVAALLPPSRRGCRQEEAG